MIKINLEEIANNLANTVAKSGISVKEFIKKIKQDMKNAQALNQMLKLYGTSADRSVYNAEKQLIETEFFKKRFYVKR